MKRVITMSTAIILGIVVAVVLMYGLRNLAIHFLETRFNSYMDEHGDEIEEKIRKAVRERECVQACMEKKKVE